MGEIQIWINLDESELIDLLGSLTAEETIELIEDGDLKWLAPSS